MKDVFPDYDCIEVTCNMCGETKEYCTTDYSEANTLYRKDGGIVVKEGDKWLDFCCQECYQEYLLAQNAALERADPQAVQTQESETETEVEPKNHSSCPLCGHEPAIVEVDGKFLAKCTSCDFAAYDARESAKEAWESWEFKINLMSSCEDEDGDKPEDGEESEKESEPAVEVTVEELQDSVARQKEHLLQIRALVDCIEDYKSVITNLKERVKTNQKLLESKQEELNALVLRGVSEQRQLPFMYEPNDPSEPEVAAKEEVQTVQPDANGSPDGTTGCEWKSCPVSDLFELTEKEIEKLSAEFETCGEVCEWLGSDFSKKITGIGEKTREKIQTAIDRIAGVTDDAIRVEAERGKAEREAQEQNDEVQE